MQTKNNTDIDRKLAIYYHPLFQEILGFVAGLFGGQQPLTLGLLEFLEFNLKLQKCLLPKFETDNALVSGLNDWVKEVAECLSFEGMVSTAGCTEVTPDNIMQLISKEIKGARIRLMFEESEYKQFLKSFVTHDAFKLLGVRINSEVFCKFLFDLCTTWCEFLDVEIFVYFLLTLALQISEGSSLPTSTFKPTRSIRTVQLDFFEDFEQLKAEYNKVKRRELRYYRAWCEWNYLRMNEIGERVILDLNDIFSGDERIQSLTDLFEKAIDTINVEITNQIKEEPQRDKPDRSDTKEFLVFKKLDVKRQPLPQRFNFIRNDQPDPQPEERHDYEVTIDEKGNMYLRKIVKIPIIGSKIQPLPQELRQPLRLEYFARKKESYRQMSNLCGLEMFSQVLPHNSKIGPYAYEKSKLVNEIDKFSEEMQGKATHKHVTQIHRRKPEAKKVTDEPKASRAKPRSLYVKQSKPVSEAEIEYDHKTIAPVFLTNKAYNIAYCDRPAGDYAKQVGAEKHNLETNLPRVLKNPVLIADTPVHLIGRFTTDRRKIRDKVLDISVPSVANRSLAKIPSTHESVVSSSTNNQSRIEQLKQSNKHIWSRYMSENEMRQLTDFNEFYEKLYKFKKMFTEEFRSDYVRMINLELEYEDTRHDMGGVLTKELRQKFGERMRKLIARDDRKKRRRKKRRGVAYHHTTKRFRSGDQRELFNHVFLDYHRNEIRRVRQQDTHNNTVIQ